MASGFQPIFRPRLQPNFQPCLRPNFGAGAHTGSYVSQRDFTSQANGTTQLTFTSESTYTSSHNFHSTADLPDYLRKYAPDFPELKASVWDEILALLGSGLLIAGGVASMLVTAGASGVVLVLGSAVTGAFLAGGISGTVYVLKQGQEFNWSEWSKTVGISMVAGATAGAVSAASNLLIVAIQETATAFLKGAISGAAAGSTSKLAVNIMLDQPWYDGLATAAGCGALAGLVGCVGAEKMAHAEKPMLTLFGFGLRGAAASVLSEGCRLAIESDHEWSTLLEGAAIAFTICALSGFLTVKEANEKWLKACMDSKYSKVSDIIEVAKKDNCVVKFFRKGEDVPLPGLDLDKDGRKIIRIELQTDEGIIGHATLVGKNGVRRDFKDECLIKAYLCGKDGEVPGISEVDEIRARASALQNPRLLNPFSKALHDYQDESFFGARAPRKMNSQRKVTAWMDVETKQLRDQYRLHKTFGPAPKNMEVDHLLELGTIRMYMDFADIRSNSPAAGQVKEYINDGKINGRLVTPQANKATMHELRAYAATGQLASRPTIEKELKGAERIVKQLEVDKKAGLKPVHEKVEQCFSYAHKQLAANFADRKKGTEHRPGP